MCNVTKYNSDKCILHALEDIKSGRLQAILYSALRTGKEEGVLESVRKNDERFTASLPLTSRKNTKENPVGIRLDFNQDYTTIFYLTSMSLL